jgi:hypothetical protein
MEALNINSSSSYVSLQLCVPNNKYVLKVVLKNLQPE